MDHKSQDEWLDHAFRLGFFLHGERDTAVQIAARAMNKLQLAAQTQNKRLYYRLTGRLTEQGAARKLRSKVSLSEPHLLQRLVYIESEPFELEKEARLLQKPAPNARLGGRSDLVIHFIKHLVRITTRRNSFYVTLGLSRLLYNYTTAETMELYNLVIQDPERVRDDYYYRSRKGILVKELKERFGDLLAINKGQRGEQRWQSNDESKEHHELVRECLYWFTPWSTPCVIPDRFDPFSDSIEKLNFDGHHPDQEHEVEVNRIHAALHPDCFARLTAANKLATPDERLELPNFQLASDDDDADHSSRTPPPISRDELQAINQLLAQEAARRKAVSAGFFRVLVDGKERAGIDSRSSNLTRFVVDETSDVIEVYGSDDQGPLLLATHLLDFSGPQTQSKAIILERGQGFAFTTNLSAANADGLRTAQVTVRYEPPAPRLFSKWFGSLAATRSNSYVAFVAWWKPAATLAALGLLAVGIWWAWGRVERNKPSEIVKTAPSPLSPAGAPLQPSPAAANKDVSEEPKQARTNETPAPPTVPRQSPAPAREPDQTHVARTIVSDTSSGEFDARESTRGWDRTVMGAPLHEVKRIYVQQSVIDSEQATEITNLLRARLARSALQASAAEQADAALKISVRPASSRPDDKRVLAIVRLVNANGYVLWPSARRRASWRYVGQPDYLAARVIADLESEIARASKTKSNQ